MAATLYDKLVWYDAGRPGTNPTKFANLGTGGSGYDMLIGGVLLNPTTMPYFDKATGAVSLPGVTSNYVFSYDRPQHDILGDMEIIAYLSMNDWTPAAAQTILAKYVGAGTRSYLLTIDTSGRPLLTTSTDGTATVANLCPTATGFADGSGHWLKVIYDVDDGAGNRVASFYTSSDPVTTDPGLVTWAFLDSVTTAVTTSIFASLVNLEIGSNASGSGNLLVGKVYRAIVKNGINGTVTSDFNPDLDAAWPYQHWVSSVSGEGYTIASPSIYTSGRPKRLPHRGKNYLWLPGITGNSATAPDSAALSITGDLELQWFGALELPANNGSLLSKFGASPNKSYALTVASTNLLNFTWSEDGTASTLVASTIPWTQGFHPEQDGGIKVTFDVDDGAGNNVVTFYTTVNGGLTWTQLGAPVTTAGATSIFDSNAVVTVGFNGNFTSGAGDQGKHYRATIKNGINGTTVFDVDFTKLTSATQTTIAEQSSNGATVTIGRSSSNRKASVVVRDIVNFGVDDWWEMKANPSGAYVYSLPASSLAVATTPDAAALDILGDIEIQWFGRLDSLSLNGSLVSKFAAVGQRSYALYLVNGVPTLVWSEDGSITAPNIKTATATLGSVGVVAGVTDFGIKATLDVDNGAVGNDVKFYYSLDDGLNWTQLGTTITTAAVTSVFASTAVLTVGYNGNITAGDGHGGRHYHALVKSGIGGTTVAEWQAAGHIAGVLTYTDQTLGNVWTEATAHVTNPNPLNLGATGTISVLAAVRQFTTAATDEIVSKRSGVVGTAAGAIGWSLSTTAGPNTSGIIDDGAFAPTDTNSSTYGALELKSFQRVVSGDRIEATKNGTPVNGTTDTTTGPINNGLAVRIGRPAGPFGGGFADMEFVMASIDPTVLSFDDLAALSSAISAMGTQTAEDLRTRYHAGRLLSTTAA